MRPKTCDWKEAKQRRLSNRKTRGQNLLAANHIEIHPTAEQEKPSQEYGERKPMVKWPKANDTASYKQFDTDVAKITSRLKGSAEAKLEQLSSLVYKEGLDRFGLEKDAPSTERRKVHQEKSG